MSEDSETVQMETKTESTENVATAPVEDTKEEVTEAKGEETEGKEENKEKEEKEEDNHFVLGLDFGSKKLVLALTKNGDMLPNIVRNNLANISTPNLISFREEKRMIGEEAMTSLTRSPQSTVKLVKRILGLNTLEQMKNELKQYKIPLKAVDSSGRSCLEIPSQSATYTLFPEEIAATFFKRIVGYVKRYYGDSYEQCLKGCVFSVPASYTAAQRQAVMDAAKIAGLPVLALVDETTAVALTYGFRHRDPEQESKDQREQDSPKEETKQDEKKPEENKTETDEKQENKPEDGTSAAAGEDSEAGKEADEDHPSKTIALIDIGHSYFGAKIVQYSHNKLKILGSVSDPNIGAIDVDNAIAEHFAAELTKKCKTDVGKSDKYMARLVKSAEKVKQVLSTIDHTYFEVENINDQDYRLQFTRETMISLCGDIQKRLEAHLTELLTSSSVEAIGAVEIVGGGTRIPFIQDTIAKVFGKKLSRTLDGASSVAMGAALMAAIASPHMELEYIVEDTAALSDDSVSGLSDAEIKAAQDRARNFAERDAQVVATQNTKNSLEQFAYEIVEKTEGGAYKDIITPEQKAKIEKISKDARSWLDENWKGTLELYTSKFSEVRGQVAEAWPELAAKEEEILTAQKKALAEAEEQAKKVKKSRLEDRRLTNTQKLAAAAKKRKQGNICFKEFDYKSAAARYTAAISLLSSMYDVNADDEAAAKALKIPCHSNLAACCIKLDRWTQAIDNCTKVLALDPENVKAMFRRGTSNQHEKKWEEAFADLSKAATLAPTDKNIRIALRKVERQLAVQKKKEKQMYSKMFG